MEKKNWHYGCPGCGDTRVTANTEVQAEVEGKINSSGDFEPGEEKVELGDVNDVEAYACATCGNVFEEPERIYQDGSSRLKFDLNMEIFVVKKVEEGSKGTSFFVRDQEAKEVVEHSLHLDFPITNLEVTQNTLEFVKNLLLGLRKVQT